MLVHWETYTAACAASGQAPALSPFGTWLAQQVAAPAASQIPAGPLVRARAEGTAAVQAWRFARVLGVRFRAPGTAAGVGSVDAFLLLYAVCKSPAPGLDKTALCRYAGLGTTTGLLNDQTLATSVHQSLRNVGAATSQLRDASHNVQALTRGIRQGRGPSATCSRTRPSPAIWGTRPANWPARPTRWPPRSRA